MDSRSSALFKRAEQLKRWQESETYKQSPNPKHAARIQFSTGTVFLAACKAGDKEEIQRLLNMGADINTPNVDGLTALHQACIDDNMDMVEFLVTHGADVNRRDNEGWTPLHATASCGIDSIARYLIENGSDVAAVNYDGELPIDLAEIPESMRALLRQAIVSQGIDCEKCRKAESAAMLADAKQWAENGYVEVRDLKTGGTPLHVAAAKGYLEVAKTLIVDCKVDVNCLDYEGWTPLHAAALWGQKEVAALLISNGAKMDLKNYSGQTCVEVVDPKISTWLKEAAMTVRRKGLMVENTIARTGSFKRAQEKPTGEPPIATYVNGERHSRDADNNEFALRRTHSFETNKTSQRYRSVTGRVKASSCSSIPPMSPQSSLPSTSGEANKKTCKTNSSADDTNKDVQNSNKEKNDTPTTNNSQRPDGSLMTTRRKTFVPPVRDDESETQRKAHAKRVRETRRSTQGVTLDEIKSAEQLVKNKNNSPVEASTSNATKSDLPSNIVKTETELVEGEASTAKVATTAPQAAAEATVFVRRSPASTATTSLNRTDEKEIEKRENEATETLSLGSDLGLCTIASPATQAAQNVIQRRRRSKRRSTGVGQVDFEDSTNDRGASGDAVEYKVAIKTEPSNWEQPSEEGNLNYKKLYEDAMLEVKRLQVQLSNTQKKLAETEAIVKDQEKGNNAMLFEIDKREKRAMIRKLSEMEEELKNLTLLQVETQRLRDENSALIRVISKLSK